MSAASAGKTSFDCIVIGGGHNGLVCAAYLARSGRSVLVLEAANQVGGAAITREFAPDFKVSACAHLLHLMPGSLIKDLGLDARGLKLAAAHMPTTAIAPDSSPLPIDASNPTLLAARSAADAAALPAYRARLRRLAEALYPVLATAIGNRFLAGSRLLAAHRLAHSPARTLRYARIAAHRRHVRAGPAGRALRDAAAQGRAGI
jgi:phytoene dehydrogenase-like protein